MRRNKTGPELSVILLCHFWNFAGILFHPGTTRGELPLKSEAGMPHCCELHQ